MNLGAFAVVAVVGRHAGDADLRHFSGLGRRSPVLAAALTLCLFSLIGVPPLAGFTAKFNVMRVLGANGGWWWFLVGVIAVNTLLSIYYYAKVIRTMYLEDDGGEPVPSNPLGTGIGLASATALVLLFVGANALTRTTTDYATLRPARPVAAPAAGTDATRPVTAAR
jgi:NADH-quinone oxidoreductase subunit N